MKKKGKVFAKKVASWLLSASLLLGEFTGLPMAVQAAEDTNSYDGLATRIADTSTINDWQKYFSNDSTQNAGGVWTDKSVFLDGKSYVDALGSNEKGVSVEVGEDNFLVALSAMASTKSIEGYNYHPTDTMLVLDLSGSMKGSVSTMVTSANKAIHDLLNLNHNNRVGVVLFSGDHYFDDSATSSATVLMPLAHYETISSSNGVPQYIRTTGTDNGQNAVTVSVASGVTPRNNLGSSKTSEGGTYTQNGIFKAMQQFVNANDKVIAEGPQAGTTRMPIMVLMSDGEPSAATRSYTDVGTSNVGEGRTGTTYASDMAFLTQLTAAYVKREIEYYYGVDSKFYTLGYSVEDNSYAQSVLDPGQYSNNRINTLWDTYNRTSAGGTFRINAMNSQNKTVTKHTDPAGRTQTVADHRDYVDQYFPAEDRDDLTDAFQSIVDEIILQSMYYPTLVQGGLYDMDGFLTFTDYIGENMEVKAIKGIQLGNTIYTGERMARWTVTGDAGGDYNNNNPSSIANNLVWAVEERMQIDDVNTARALINSAYEAGQFSYNLSTGEFSNYIGWYADADGKYLGFWDGQDTYTNKGNAVYAIKSYFFLDAVGEGNRETDMLYAHIQVRTALENTSDADKGEQIVIGQLPASLIPLREYHIQLDGTNLANPESMTIRGAASPSRLLYEVGLSSKIDLLNIGATAPMPLKKVTDENDPHFGNYVFYTNQYDMGWDSVTGDGSNLGNLVDEQKYNATTSWFEPSVENERYYYTEDSVIYTNTNGSEYTNPTKPSANGTYYRRYAVYTGSGSSVRQQWVYEQISSEVLSNHLKQRDDGQWVVQRGAIHHYWADYKVEKTANETDTSKYSDHPFIHHLTTDNYHVDSVLGNNGKLLLNVPEGIKITKIADDTIENRDQEYTFEVISNTALKGTYQLIIETANGTRTYDSTTFEEAQNVYVAEISLKTGESAYILGLPVDTVLTVTEKIASGDLYAVKSITVDGKQVNAAGITVAADKITTAEFVNTKVVDGDLAITKKVESVHPDHHTNKTFKFVVTLVNPEGAVVVTSGKTFNTVNPDGTPGTVAVTEGENGALVITGITLKADETLTIEGIPNGVKTIVEEIEVENDGFTSDKAEVGNKVELTIVTGQTQTAEFTNTYTPSETDPPTNLVIKGVKELTYDGTWSDSFEFEFVLEERVNNETNPVLTESIEILAPEDGDNSTTVEFVFDKLEKRFNTAGIYPFRVVEKIPANSEDKISGMIYDTIAANFEIVVSDDKNGKLYVSEVRPASNEKKIQIVPKTEDGVTTYEITAYFENQYVSTGAAEAIIHINKLIQDTGNVGVLPAGFQFELVDAETGSQVALSGTTNAIGNTTIRVLYDDLKSEDIPTDGVITYRYILREMNGGNTVELENGSMKYSDQQYYVIVKVHANKISDTAVEYHGISVEIYDMEDIDDDGNPTDDPIVSDSNIEPPTDIAEAPAFFLSQKPVETPETPADPAVPGETVTPGESETPAEPETPADPENPAEPETPVDPEEPAEPETPADPEEPAEPETPVDPEEPAEPETPEDPEEPVEPETPTEPDTSEESDVELVSYQAAAVSSDSFIQMLLNATANNELRRSDMMLLNTDDSVDESEETDEEPVEPTDESEEEPVDESTEETPVEVETVVELSSATENAVIYYMTDADEDFSVYDGNGIVVVDGTVIYAYASAEGMIDSNVVICEYTIGEDGEGKIAVTENEAAVLSDLSEAVEAQQTNKLFVAEAWAKDDKNKDVGVPFTNTYTPEPVTTSISGSKVLTGRDEWTDTDSFTIELYKATENGTLIVEEGETEAQPEATVTVNKDQKDFIFQEINALSFTSAGTYYFVVKEQAGTLPGIAYDDKDYSVTVTVTGDPATGKLSAITSVADGPIVFTNTYSTKPATGVTIEGTKTFTGRTLSTNMFSFELLDADGNVLQTVSNLADGSFKFVLEDFTAADEYQYTVREIVPNKEGKLHGITYDTREYDVTVKVIDVGGALSAEVVYEDGSIVFENKYEAAPVSVTLSGTKQLEGKALVDDEFSFNLYSATFSNGQFVKGNLISTVKNTNGIFTFDLGSFTTARGYRYIIEEVPGGDKHYTYDTASYEILVDVADFSFNGQLQATIYVNGRQAAVTSSGTSVALDDSVIVFRNYWHPSPITVELSGTKAIEGRELTANDVFTFELYQTDETYTVTGDPVLTATNNVDGTFTFTESMVTRPDVGEVLSDYLTFTDEDTRYYVIKEQAGSDNSLIYDTAEYKVKVEVKLVNNVLVPTITVVGGSSIAFTNSDPDDATFTVNGTKKLLNFEGNEIGMSGRTFTFELYEATRDLSGTAAQIIIGEKIAETSSNTNGAFSFSNIGVDSPGTKYFVIKELAGRYNDIEYDTKEYLVEVEVALVNGKLVAGTPEITLDGDHVPVVFTNKHIPGTTDITVTKQWVDDDNSNNLRPSSITLILYADGVEYRRTAVSPDADGNWSYTFEKLPTENVNGMIVYTVGEEKVPGYTTSVNGMAITNTLDTIDLSGTKTWDDDDNRDGQRPPSITVNLLANGTKVDSVTVNAPGTDVKADWSYAFYDLPEFDKAGQKIVYTVTEEPIPGYTTVIDGLDITNTHVPETTSIRITKVWDDNHNQDGVRPKSVTVNLYANDVFAKSETLSDNHMDSNGNWWYEFADLPKYEGGEEIVYTVTENTVANYTTSINGYTIANTHEPKTIDLTANKIWNDNTYDNLQHPTAIKFKLYADGEQVGNEVTASADGSGNIQYTWNDLPAYKNGIVIEYRVYETELYYADTNSWVLIEDSLYSPNYKYDVTFPSTSDTPIINVTNTYDPEKRNLTVSKVWDDNSNSEGLRPASIVVRLLSNGTPITAEKMQNYGYDANEIAALIPAGASDVRITLSETNHWAYTWTNLVLKDKSGNEIKYDVEEIGVTNGVFVNDPSKDYDDYTTEIEHVDGRWRITNSRIPETTSVTVQKAWNDGENQDGVRPESIVVNLKYRKVGETVWHEYEDAKLSANINWQHTFTNLPVYLDGVKLEYAVNENAIGSYDPTYNDDGEVVAKVAADGTVTITNAHEPAETQISVTKVWEDANNQDGIRPESVTFALKANDVITKTVSVKEEDNWTYTFTDLPVNADGEEIKYTVVEMHNSVELDEDDSFDVNGDQIADYTVSMSGDVVSGVIFTNTHTPETISVSGTKTWNDKGNSIDHPEITVVLLADGVEVQTTTVSNGTYSFKDLPKYKDGKEIDYTVKEENVPGYTSSVNGFDITNTLITTSLSGMKGWDDNGNQDGKRPTSIKIHLLANDKDTEKFVVVTENNGEWRYTFTDLPVYDVETGEKITYTIEEEVPDGYTVRYITAANGINLINTHTPELITIGGTKVWEDANNQDGKRPESITIELLANGKVIRTKHLTHEEDFNPNEWSYTFEHLPKYEGGNPKPIEYTVVEVYGNVALKTGDSFDVNNDNTDDYTVTYDGFKITNSHEPETTELTVNKVWEDEENKDKTRPDSITVELYKSVLNRASGKVDGVAPLTLNAENGWTGKFENLPKYEDGVEIIYYVIESATGLDGYVAHYEGAGTGAVTITNTRSEETNISVLKEWNDQNDRDGKRPVSVEVALFDADNKQVKDSIVLNADNNWSGMWEKVDAFDSDGNRIDYHVKEIVNGQPVAENEKAGVYVVSYDENAMSTDHVVINTYVPETTKVSGAKIWNDENDRDGLRPASIKVTLLADGKEVTHVHLSSENEDSTDSNKWNYSFSNLPKYRDHGVEIVYTVIEEYNDVELEFGDSFDINNDGTNDYTVTYSGTSITNSHEIETITIEGEKVWNDGNNQDCLRPSYVDLELIAVKPDGTEVRTNRYARAYMQNNWKFKFENVKKYGKLDDADEAPYELTYKVVERTKVEGYEVTGFGLASNGYTVTNTHEPQTTDITVTKQWADYDDYNELRPESITVTLFADGEKVGDSVVLTAETGWTYTWTKLPKHSASYEPGRKIEYTVEENPVEHYTATYGDDKLTLINTLDEMEIEIRKIWDDDDDNRGDRPSSIKVEILRDSKVERTLTLTEREDWVTTFTWYGEIDDLSVREINVPSEYRSIESKLLKDEDGYYFSITNIYIDDDEPEDPEEEEKDVKVRKVWSGGDSKNRPEIRVRLYKDGKAYRTVTLSDGNWRHVWEDISDDDDIEWSVEELDVPKGYEAKVRQVSDRSFIITNTWDEEENRYTGA